MAEPHSSEVNGLAKKLEDRAYTTYKARLKTHYRLRFRAVAWNASLLSTATATTIAAVGLLSDPQIYGAHGDTVLATLAILSLVASLIVANMNYAGRVQAAEGNYKRIQQIALLAEALQAGDSTLSDVRSVQREYEIALESSENHSEADYLRTLDCVSTPWKLRRDTLVSLVPFVALAAPVGVAVPLIAWLVHG